MVDFTVTHESASNKARAGVLQTPHGRIETPAFMPVGTQATVKTLEAEDLERLGYGIILSNTYHLYLRPGIEVIARHGGLHPFMNWNGSILTDSGGFQVFSLESLRQVDDHGIAFKSHVDGSSHYLTPEKVIRLQNAMGADIIMQLDQCPAYPSPYNEVEEAVRRTTAWAYRCRAAHLREDQSLFGIIQGGVHRELRERSAAELVELDFPGYALGGLSVGEPKEEMYRVLDYTTPLIPLHKPRYLMGIGSPDALLEAVRRGVDLFDSVMPTRMARNARVITGSGYLNLRNSFYTTDLRALDPECSCKVCSSYSRAYIRHLLQAGEVLGIRLTTYHNLYFIKSFMDRIRKAIREDSWNAVERVWEENN